MNTAQLVDPNEKDKIPNLGLINRNFSCSNDNTKLMLKNLDELKTQKFSLLSVGLEP